MPYTGDMPASAEQNLNVILENCDFEEKNDITKAKRLITAAYRFLAQTPAAQSEQGNSLQMNHATVQDLLQRAQQFVEYKQRQSSGGVRFLSAADGFRR